MPARFSVVDDYVLRGGAPSEEDLHLLKDVWGVKNILSLDDKVAKRIAPIVNSLGLHHIIFPIHYSEGIKDLKDNIRNLLQIPSYACEECGSEPGVNIDCSTCNHHGRTFVHCFHGKDRTSLAIAFYRMAYGCEPEEAYKEALSFDMGKGLDPSVQEAYKEAILEDVSSAMDADTVNTVSETNLDRVDVMPSSFAPFVDTNPMLRKGSLIIYGKKKNLPGKWSLKPVEGYVKAFLNEFVKKIDKKLNKEDVISGIENGEKGILFTDYLAVIDPRILSYEDSNDVLPSNGVVSNYDGLAPYSFPGSGGIALDVGGYGGFVQLPMTRY
jgi:hypothetical protein